MSDVIAQHLLFHFVQGGANRVNLREDVYAIAILVDHAHQAADLALDALEPRENRPPGRILQGRLLDTIPVGGI